MKLLAVYILLLLGCFFLIKACILLLNVIVIEVFAGSGVRSAAGRACINCRLYIASAGLHVYNWLCYDKCFDFIICNKLIVHGVVGFMYLQWRLFVLFVYRGVWSEMVLDIVTTERLVI